MTFARVDDDYPYQITLKVNNMLPYSHGLVAIALFVTLLFPGQIYAQSLSDLFGGALFKQDKAPKAPTEKFFFGDESANKKIVYFKLKGIIRSSEDSMNPLKKSMTMRQKIRYHLKWAAKDPDVKGIILEINSPGGEAVESDILYNEFIRFRKKTGKKVLCYFAGLAASGGYYIGCGADKIISHPSTITGSIGVIIKTVNIEELMGKIGIKDVTIKSSKTPFKDILSSTKTMSKEEKKIILELVDNMYERFVSVVSKARKLPLEKTREIADGRIYTASKALALGLVDQLGYRDDALDLMKQMTTTKSLKVITYKRKIDFMEALMGMSQNISPKMSFPEQLTTTPGLYMIWHPY